MRTSSTQPARGPLRDFGIFVSIALGAQFIQCSGVLFYAVHVGFNPGNHAKMGATAIAFAVAACACAWNLWRLR